uniref:Uncharacterized protein n=1 Tax=uncultured marine virus TaxID=186617 RepID=A0A0F7L661_9VIRU|nr:hypothetical protein [uncultured marine virus]
MLINLFAASVFTNLEAVRSSSVAESNSTSASVSMSCGVERVIVPSPLSTTSI